MADSILGLIAQGPQQSPIQGYLKGRELKAQREERASMEKSRSLQQQRLAQVMRKEATAEELQDFFFSSVAAFSMDDKEKRKAFWENTSKKYRPESMVGGMAQGMLDDGVSDKSLAQSIALGQGIGVLPAPEKAQPPLLKTVKMRKKLPDGRFTEVDVANTPEEIAKHQQAGWQLGDRPPQKRAPLIGSLYGTPTQDDAQTPQPVATAPTVEELKGGVGPGSAALQAVNNVLGWLVPGVPAKNTADARNKVRLVNRSIKGAFKLSQYGAKHDLKALEDVLPSPDKVFQDPDELPIRYANAKRMVEEQLASKQAYLQKTNLTKTIYNRVQKDIEQLETLLQSMPREAFNPYSNKSFEELQEIDLDTLSEEQIRQMHLRLDALQGGQ